jgi:hypothetical protein
MWKSHAREYLERRDLPAEALSISFNRWFTDRSYRMQIAASIGLASSDAGLNDVARWGPNTWGDSFDGLSYDGDAQRMDVLQRFGVYEHNSIYLSLFDREMIDLSLRTHGTVAGTEGIIRAVLGR